MKKIIVTLVFCRTKNNNITITKLRKCITSKKKKNHLRKNTNKNVTNLTKLHCMFFFYLHSREKIVYF